MTENKMPDVIIVYEDEYAGWEEYYVDYYKNDGNKYLRAEPVEALLKQAVENISWFHNWAIHHGFLLKDDEAIKDLEQTITAINEFLGEK